MTYKEEIEKAIKIQDLIDFPFIAYVNPSLPQETRDMIIKLGRIKKVVEDTAVEPWKVILVQRTVLEFIDPPEPLKPIFESTTTCNECCGDFVECTVEEQIKHDRESLRETIDKLQGEK